MYDSGSLTGFAVTQILITQHKECFRAGANYGCWLDP